MGNGGMLTVRELMMLNILKNNWRQDVGGFKYFN